MDREQALDAALGQIERQFGKGAVMKMNDRAAVSDRRRSRPARSRSTSRSGSAACRAGASSRSSARSRPGKTTLVYHVIAEAQRRGGICAFIDAEHAMDPTYAKRIGVNIDNLLVSQPDTGEQALEIAELLIRSRRARRRRGRLGRRADAEGGDRRRDGRHATSACRRG